MSRRPLIIALAVLAAGIVLGLAFVDLSVRRQREAARAEARTTAAALALALDRRLERLTAAAEALALAQSTAPPSRFPILAAATMQREPALEATLLVGATEIVATRPAGPPLSDLEASSFARVGLSGPARLLGGRGAVLMAVAPLDTAAADGDRTVVVAAVDRVLAAADLTALTAGFDYHLQASASGDRPRTLARSSERTLAQPVEHRLTRGDFIVTLALAPRTGWPTFGDLHFETLLALVAALTAALVAYDLASKPERLSRTAVHRSHHLDQARAELSSEISLRHQAEARGRLNALDQLARLVVLAAARPAASSRRDILAEVGAVLRDTGLEYRANELDAALDRAEEHGLIAGDAEAMHIADPEVASLPEITRPLEEVARESLGSIGAYRLQERLGSGGMGEVFRAINVHDGSAAAIKLLYPHTLADAELRRRFDREATIILSLRDDSIVRVLERGEHRGRPYLALEMIEGETLEATAQRGPVPAPEALAMVADLARALSILHAAGIIHRDVKSANVMRRPSGACVLLDFGIASAPTELTMTRTNSVIGTVPFMAPERLQGAQADPRIDVWAAGVILYQLLVGHLPWHSAASVRLMHEIINTVEVDLEPAMAAAGPAVAALLRRILATDPSQRLADGGQLAEALRDLGATASRERMGDTTVITPPERP